MLLLWSVRCTFEYDGKNRDNIEMKENKLTTFWVEVFKRSFFFFAGVSNNDILFLMQF